MLTYWARGGSQGERRPNSSSSDPSIRGVFSPGEPDRYNDVTDNLRWSDYFLVCSDFATYYDKQREVDEAFRDRDRWIHMAALNTARTGWFSSDRTINGYMNDIWAAHSVTA